MVVVRYCPKRLREVMFQCLTLPSWVRLGFLTLGAREEPPSLPHWGWKTTQPTLVVSP